jgi:NAD(P)-dependent dehydrogenase (short-subunit alcohol dehydrogenase family)
VTGRTIVITGASDGIGAAAARRLCRNGENVVVVGRTESKTIAVAAELNADYFVADFAELSQTRALARELRSRYARIDVLANNAGAMPNTLRITNDGYDRTYQVNYLAPFLLTTLLLDVLVESRAAVVNTSSVTQKKLLSGIDVEDLEKTDRRRPRKSYALAKLAIVLFTMELHRRYHSAGLSTAAFDPGFVDTNFGPASASRLIAAMRRTPVRRLAKTADQGADQLVWLASSVSGTDWKSGEYYSRHRIAKASPRAYDPVLSRELWDRSLASLAT